MRFFIFKRFAICFLFTTLALLPTAQKSQAAIFAHIANSKENTVSLIDTVSNTIATTPISAGESPFGVAVKPD